jgi:2-dehydro-3-deoxy-D-arabinonate dehydratase
MRVIMKLCKVRDAGGQEKVGSLENGSVHVFDAKEVGRLSDILHAPDPLALATKLKNAARLKLQADEANFLSPADQQEVWAAGVTYKRSQEARERESQGAARFYDLVYSAPRPELFFKAAPGRACGLNDVLRIRRDSRWNVPEPELALVISPDLRIVGYTIGNDMSSRDIEGENPLYLPQAKVYDCSCALGPVITLAAAMPPLEEVAIGLHIERAGKLVFEGTTSVGRMKRSPEELVAWLSRENSFPLGAVLLTGTGVIPPDDFTLEPGDNVTIDITGIGQLINVIGQSPPAKS